MDIMKNLLIIVIDNGVGEFRDDVWFSVVLYEYLLLFFIVVLLINSLFRFIEIRLFITIGILFFVNV